MPHEPSDHVSSLAYEIPPTAQASERHAEFCLVRGDAGVRITGVYRAIWGKWRRVVRTVGGTGFILFIIGSMSDALRGRAVNIDLGEMRQSVQGSPIALVGLGLVVIAIVAWAIVRLATWKRLHRLEIEAGTDELLIRHEYPPDEQTARRWPTSAIEQVSAEQTTLVVRARREDGDEMETFELAIGGPTTAPYWIAEQIRVATKLAPPSPDPYPW